MDVCTEIAHEKLCEFGLGIVFAGIVLYGVLYPYPTFQKQLLELSSLVSYPLKCLFS
jgi:hypothetical protein